jgi:ketosteroid isomerase-like protein
VSVADVSAVLERYRRAIIAGDRGCLDELLDDDYQFISARAGVVDREQRLTALVAGYGHLADLAFSNVHIRLVGGVALVRAHFRADFRPHTGRTDPDRGVSTLVFSRCADRWRLYHQHNSHES